MEFSQTITFSKNFFLYFLRFFSFFFVQTCFLYVEFRLYLFPSVLRRRVADRFRAAAAALLFRTARRKQETFETIRASDIKTTLEPHTHAAIIHNSISPIDSRR